MTKEQITELMNLSLKDSKVLKGEYIYLPSNLIEALCSLGFTTVRDFLHFSAETFNQFSLEEYESRHIKPLEYLQGNVAKKSGFLVDKDLQQREYNELEKELQTARAEFEKVKQYRSLVKDNLSRIMFLAEIANKKIDGELECLSVKLSYQQNTSDGTFVAVPFSREILAKLGFSEEHINIINQYILENFKNLDTPEKQRAYQDMTLLNLLVAVYPSHNNIWLTDEIGHLTRYLCSTNERKIWNNFIGSSEIRKQYQKSIHVNKDSGSSILLSNLVEKGLFPSSWCSLFNQLGFHNLQELCFLSKEELIATINAEKQIANIDRIMVLNRILIVLNSQEFKIVRTLLTDLYYESVDNISTKYEMLSIPIKNYNGDLDSLLLSLGLSNLSSVLTEQEKVQLNAMGTKNFLAGGQSGVNRKNTLIEIIQQRYKNGSDLIIANILREISVKLQKNKKGNNQQETSLQEPEKYKSVNEPVTMESLLNEINDIRSQLELREAELAKVQDALYSLGNTSIALWAQPYDSIQGSLIMAYRKMYSLKYDIQQIEKEQKLSEIRKRQHTERMEELKSQFGIETGVIDDLNTEFFDNERKVEASLEERKQEKQRELNEISQRYYKLVSVNHPDFDKIMALLKKEVTLKEQIDLLQEYLQVRLRLYPELQNQLFQTNNMHISI